MRKRRNVGSVDFECPNCGRLHHRTLWEEVEDYDECGGPVTSDLVVCKCGAKVFCADDYDSVGVYWLNKREFEQLRFRLWLQTKPHIRPASGLYYDLIRVPHGHLPASKVFLWHRLPIPVKEIRDENYFRCPDCGSKSFFKPPPCRVCISRNDDLYRSEANRWLREANQRAALTVQRERQDYFRSFWKQLECLVLPLLVLIGQAWYVRSKRRHYSD